MSESSKINILLISQHRLIQDALQSLLAADSKCNLIRSVYSVETAIEAIRQLDTKIDLILLQTDVKVSDSLRELGEYCDSPVIIISTLANRELMDDWVLAGIRGILGPDTDSAQFSKALQKVHEGELWLDRFTTSRIVGELSKKRNESFSPESNPIAKLTEREKGILRAILDGEGLPLRDIAATLFISEFTLRNHLTAIYSKLGVANRLDLYVFTRLHLASLPKNSAPS